MTTQISSAQEAKAILRSVRVSPTKLNLVAAMIRGKTAAQALRELTFSKRRISDDVRKTLLSAVSNAENNHGMDIDQLIVFEAYVGKGAVMKRWRARARGRVGRIQKPFSHLTITVREQAAS
ncbi:MAG: 50S ribosomal protein L22 [bacterium]|nr:50S ribosomal protein L22 [bacterium]